jgi:hypothetical protein
MREAENPFSHMLCDVQKDNFILPSCDVCKLHMSVLIYTIAISDYSNQTSGAANATASTALLKFV